VSKEGICKKKKLESSLQEETSLARNLDVFTSLIRICRLLYRFDALQAHSFLYLLIDYNYRHSIV
jgi:hypothetical protein